MNKIVNISIQEPYKLLCSFNNGEQRLLDLVKVLNINQKYTNKIFNTKTFSEVKIGSFGEIYWNNVAEMKDLKGNTIPCEYDICPDFAYLNSTLVK